VSRDRPAGRWLRITAAALAAAIPLLAAGTLAPAGAGLPLPRAGPRRATIVEPRPPVDAESFAFEPRGVAPRDGDGRIPNPLTPTGRRFGPPSSCSRTFVAGRQVTSSTVNTAIAAVENRIAGPYVICLRGRFTAPIHVWGKYARALLTITSAPHSRAELDLGEVRAGDADPNEFTGTAGGVSVVDSRGVEISRLTIKNYTTRGSALTPAGIYVTVQGGAEQGRKSACFVRGDHVCGDIYLIGDTVSSISNSADEDATSKHWCDNANVDAFGIAVESFGSGAADALQHVVIEDDTVDHTRTGQSETLAVNGDVEDFLVARNLVYDTDNIGIDAIGWESGTDQARHGFIGDNTVANVDTWGNYAYGQWSGSVCRPLAENAAGIYDDGASYLWIDDNVVDNSNQGIDLDVETDRRFTDHLLVSFNTVVDDEGTSLADPSRGSNPKGVPGPSDDAGHAFEAFYVDAFGSGGRIEDVYAHDNVFENKSQYYGATSRQVAPVVEVAGDWRDVLLWDNTIEGGGARDRLNLLLELDSAPAPQSTGVIDCTDYRLLSSGANFAQPDGATYARLSAWKADNSGRWDRHSAVGRPDCPASTP
jgi:hypothetical protein